MKGTDLALLGAELVQPVCKESRFAESQNSPVGLLHLQLLDMVSHDQQQEDGT